MSAITCLYSLYAWFTLLVCIQKTRNTRKAIARGRTDHFAAGVSYLQFQIQVRFISTLPDLAPQFQSFTFSRERDIFPVTLNTAV